MQKIYINDEIYEHGFWFIWGCEHKEAINFINKRYGTNFPAEEEVKGVTSIKGDNPYCLWIENKKEAGYPNFTLDHELIHVVHNVMRRVGIILTDESDEAYTNYFQYLKRKIWKALKKI